jgi:short-subunit dehydrogenase
MQQTRPVALITGGSSGIGATFARALAARGYDLILVARRRDLLEQIAAEVRSVAVEVLEADLTDHLGVRAVEERIASCPNLALLVNNAGFGTVGMFPAVKLEAQDKMHRLHVLAPLHLTHAALRGMVARNRGAVINVSSVAGFGMSPGNVSYCATKAWMNSFTEGLAMELRAQNSAVTVQALCPGFTRSGFHQTMGVEQDRIPKSLWMKSDDVVAASLRGLDDRKLFVIPGWKYRMFVVMLRVLPRSVRYALNVRAGRKMKRI